MKTMLLLAMALISANGFAQEYSGPSFSSLHNLCHAEGHVMKTLGKCLRSKLDKYYPNWQTSDDDSKQVAWYLEYLDTLGESVRKKGISEERANELAKNELLSLATAKQKKKQEEKSIAAEMAAYDASVKEEKRKREEQKQLEQDRHAAELATQAAIEEQQSAARSAMIRESGMRLMEMGRRRYAPPPPMPVTCTSDRWNGYYNLPIVLQ